MVVGVSGRVWPGIPVVVGGEVMDVKSVAIISSQTGWRAAFNASVYVIYNDAYSIMLGLLYIQLGTEDW
jgi:hypothetical protein